MFRNICQKLSIEKENFGASTGQWWSQSKTHLLDSINPADDQTLGSVYVATAADYEIIVKKSFQAFQTWREIPAPKRAEVVRLIGEALRQKKDYLGTLVSLEVGKIKSEGDGEVQEMIDMADFAVGLSRTLYGKIIPSERFRHQMMEQWQPLGPIGVISAFNFPVAVWAWNAFLAVVCGNTVIWKPSSKAPLVALAIQHVCNQVMRQCGYEGIFSLFISSDNELSLKMVEDQRLSLISFTGSTPVGKQVSQAIAKRLGKCLLELGGNNAVIVTESADFKKVIPSTVFGAVGTAGQRCTSTRRVFIHESRYQELIDKLVTAYNTIKIGNPLEEGILLGPVIDQDAVAQYKTAIAELKTQGAEILVGGNVLDRKGCFVEPTIVKAQHNWDIVQRETFVPILYVMTYHELSEAIAMHNGVSQGLSSAIFTENLQEAATFISAVGSDCGIANVNIGTSGAEIGGAFGGEKETGGGREAGSDSWKAYMRRQTTTINWSDKLPLAQGVTFNLED